MQVTSYELHICISDGAGGLIFSDCNHTTVTITSFPADDCAGDSTVSYFKNDACYLSNTGEVTYLCVDE